MPFINFTQMQEISYTAYVAKGKKAPYNMFPRWIAPIKV